MNTAFASLVAASLKSERFTLVDVGCSGGLEPVWRLFGERFRAVGFDASAAECRRLQDAEKHPDVHYIAGFTDIPPDHPFARYSEGKPTQSRNPFGRTSAARMLAIRSEQLKQATHEERIQHNAWNMTELADPKRQLYVPQELERIGFGNVDLLKIDIDGSDFRVLNSFEGCFDAFGILAARMEVNLYGGPEDTIHTFHNTDLFMRRQGFDLVALDPRNYAMSGLPSPFAISMPAQTTTGRIYQAEAFYLRDAASPDCAAYASTMGSEKLAKLAAIFSLWQQPDGAAEILNAFRDRLGGLFDVDAGLDLLAAQSQPDDGTPPLGYRDYMASFEADSASFYPRPWTPPPPKTLGRRIAEAWRSFVNPNRTHKY